MRFARIVATHAITNGALAQASDDETVGSYFSYTHRLLNEVLRKAALTFDDIRWVVPQNTNVNAWAILARLLGLDPGRVHTGSIADVGHIISSDNVVNLLDLEKKHPVKTGEKLLLFMAGFGLNWQAVVLEMVCDSCAAAGFLVLALRYNSVWLGAAMMVKGAQLALHATHLTDHEDPHVAGANLYALGLTVISFAILGIILAGTIASVGARRRAASTPAGAAAPGSAGFSSALDAA